MKQFALIFILVILQGCATEGYSTYDDNSRKSSEIYRGLRDTAIKPLLQKFDRYWESDPALATRAAVDVKKTYCDVNQLKKSIAPTLNEENPNSWDPCQLVQIFIHLGALKSDSSEFKGDLFDWPQYSPVAYQFALLSEQYKARTLAGQPAHKSYMLKHVYWLQQSVVSFELNSVDRTSSMTSDELESRFSKSSIVQLLTRLSLDLATRPNLTDSERLILSNGKYVGSPQWSDTLSSILYRRWGYSAYGLRGVGYWNVLENYAWLKSGHTFYLYQIKKGAMPEKKSRVLSSDAINDRLTQLRERGFPPDEVEMIGSWMRTIGNPWMVRWEELIDEAAVAGRDDIDKFDLYVLNYAALRASLSRGVPLDHPINLILIDAIASEILGTPIRSILTEEFK